MKDCSGMQKNSAEGRKFNSDINLHLEIGFPLAQLALPVLKETACMFTTLGLVTGIFSNSVQMTKSCLNILVFNKLLYTYMQYVDNYTFHYLATFPSTCSIHNLLYFLTAKYTYRFGKMATEIGLFATIFLTTYMFTFSHLYTKEFSNSVNLSKFKK